MSIHLSTSGLAERLKLNRRAGSWRGDGPACRYPHAVSLRVGRDLTPPARSGEAGRAKQRDTFEPEQLLKLIQTTHSGLTQHIKQGRAIYGATNQPISLVVALLYLFHQGNAALARQFAAAWETGERSGKFKPLALMHGQITMKQEADCGRVHDVERAALIVKAWNLFVARRRGIQSDMRWKLSEPFREIAR